MKFVSTRDQDKKSQALDRGVSFATAMRLGLAADGGLFVPESLPKIVMNSDPESLLKLSNLSFPDLSIEILKPFLDDSTLSKNLPAIAKSAFNFPLTLKFLPTTLSSNDKTAVLELFHGPTAAFKDFGARFLASCEAALEPQATDRLEPQPSMATRTVIVATSGDTGGAVASAFSASKIPAIILFPKDKISKRQELQLTTWGPLVQAFKVRGTFDDCQRIVKEALGHKSLQKKYQFLSANSINVARLLAQVCYHAKASLEYFRMTGTKPTLIVPSGNLGNGVAALWALKMGFPIEHIVLATNANATIPDYFASGRYEPKATVETLANAMDVSRPSNFERLKNIEPHFDVLKKSVSSISISDREIRAAIEQGPQRFGEIWCPHTATAVVAKEKLKISNAIIEATAHPAKFETIVEPLIKKSIDLPQTLADLAKKSAVSTEIAPSLEALTQALEG